tara:strand:- start:3024 stop:3146 length:123 start_codon:yes stop_codon:yes gene_type:complete
MMHGHFIYIRTGNGMLELDLPEAILHTGKREGTLKLKKEK